MWMLSIFHEIWIVILTLSIVGVLYSKRCHIYWKRKRIFSPKTRLFFGNSQNPLTRKTSMFQYLKGIYDEAKARGEKHCGIYTYTVPAYMPIDLAYIKNITTKHFQHFEDRGLYYNEKADPLSVHLVSVGGEKWRKLRTKLTPTFTSGKMKTMFPIVVSCAEKLVEVAQRNLDEALDAKDILGHFTTDVIGSCAFGLNCESFGGQESKFRVYGRKVFESSKRRILRTIFCMTFPELALFLNVVTIPREISEFFLNVVKQTVTYREETRVDREDFLKILMEMREGDGGGNEGLSIEEMAAQAFVFFLAGFETSSMTMAFCLFELARNEEIQEELRREIKCVTANFEGVTSYDAMSEMKLLEQVIYETLRKYPPAPMLVRKCTADYILPGVNSTLEKGIRVFIPVYALHYDPDYFPQPEKFDPERFSAKYRSKIHPSSYLPFGDGPRICIGARFGMMQIKVGLIMLLKHFSFSLNENTKLPLEFDPNAFLLATKGPILLNVRKI